MTKHPASAAPDSAGSRESSRAALTIVCNGEPRVIAPGTTVAAFVESLQLSPLQVAVEINLELVPRAVHAQHQLADGDRVEIVSLVGGG